MAITAGYDHACAIRTSGDVECWGSNPYGQLGNGTLIATDRPQGFVIGVTQGDLLFGADRGGAFLDTAYGFSCTIQTDNTVWCWGANNHGQLGGASPSIRSDAVQTLVIPY